MTVSIQKNYRRKLNIKFIIFTIYIISFIIYGLYRSTRTLSMDYCYLTSFLIDSNNLYSQGYLIFSIVDLLFLSTLIIGYSVLLILLVCKNKLFKGLFTIFQILIWITFIIKFPLLISSNIHVTTSGMISNIIFKDFSFVFNIIIESQSYMLGIMVFSIALLIIPFVWKSNYFNKNKYV